MPHVTPQDAALRPLLELLAGEAEPGRWRKCVVTAAKGHTATWQKLTAQPVKLNRGAVIKIVTTAAGKETTATAILSEWATILSSALDGGPCHLNILADDHDWHARKTKSGRWLVSRGKPSLSLPAGSTPEPHDRPKNRQLDPEEPRVRRLFIEAGLFAKNGQLLGDGADKFRQVQHYLELLRPLPVWEMQGPVRVLDAGCGKAYLSLALLLWAELHGKAASLLGVDASAEVIDTVTSLAARAGLPEARFESKSITEHAENGEPADLLVSLHACDTATDEALAAGIRLGAQAIVLVPCCHHELSAQIEAASKAGSIPADARWRAALGHGLARNRLADLVTDSLRAAALEALGYRVDLVEFVTPEITARNLMIRAVRRSAPAKATLALASYRSLADEWHVKPALEGLLGRLWPPDATTSPR